MIRSPVRTTLLIAVVASSATLAGCMTPSSRHHGSQDNYYGAQDAQRSCHDCGTVVDIDRADGDASGGGAVIGAVVGGLVGNQVGSGSGRRAATVAGAVAGGVAGHQIEQHRDSDSYEVHVRLDSGRDVVLEQRNLGQLRVGSHVRIVNGRAQLR